MVLIYINDLLDISKTIAKLFADNISLFSVVGFSMKESFNPDSAKQAQEVRQL